MSTVLLRLLIHQVDVGGEFLFLYIFRCSGAASVKDGPSRDRCRGVLRQLAELTAKQSQFPRTMECEWRENVAASRVPPRAVYTLDTFLCFVNV